MGKVRNRWHCHLANKRRKEDSQQKELASEALASREKKIRKEEKKSNKQKKKSRKKLKNINANTQKEAEQQATTSAEK